MNFKVKTKYFFKKLIKTTHYRISIIYLIISILWIIYSDQIAAQLFTSYETFQQIQSIKGLLFVIATAILIFFLIRNDYKTIKIQNEQIKESKRKMQVAFDAGDIGMYHYDFDNEKLYLDNKSKLYFKFNINTVEIDEVQNINCHVSLVTDIVTKNKDLKITPFELR
ncbi:MAG: hypothetical protein H6610_11720 [Ignavibacteriales bacterium]|nr:hypothetical protein [Ignavibacteriales bacterium]MCB9210421.1 hypothetical protein [Ignavibacteriales bacterium]MCB9220112.1 hypothetical protein [Ignavibacteriales bacterium]MCB9259808.1 hypothetical protein [Ignavibacteriales bacterium]